MCEYDTIENDYDKSYFYDNLDFDPNLEIVIVVGETSEQFTPYGSRTI